MSSTKQLAEKIGLEYHQMHALRNIAFNPKLATPHGTEMSWDAFVVCTHEICEDSHTLIAHLAKEPVSHV